MQESIIAVLFHVTTSRTGELVSFWKHLAITNAVPFINIAALHLVLIILYIYIYILYIYISFIMLCLIYMLLTWKFQDMRAKNAPDSSAIWHEQECCFCFVSVFEFQICVGSESLIHWAIHKNSHLIRSWRIQSFWKHRLNDSVIQSRTYATCWPFLSFHLKVGILHYFPTYFYIQNLVFKTLIS